MPCPYPDITVIKCVSISCICPSLKCLLMLHDGCFASLQLNIGHFQRSWVHCEGLIKGYAHVAVSPALGLVAAQSAEKRAVAAAGAWPEATGLTSNGNLPGRLLSSEEAQMMRHLVQPSILWPPASYLPSGPSMPCKANGASTTCAQCSRSETDSPDSGAPFFDCVVVRRFHSHDPQPKHQEIIDSSAWKHAATAVVDWQSVQPQRR